LFQFILNRLFPGHLHKRLELISLLEGSGGVYGKWIMARWANATETGIFGEVSLSGNARCILLTVNTIGSKYG